MRALTGTDDNSLKNVLAARAAGVSTAELVAANSAAFTALREPLQLSFDSYTHTSTDPRHRETVTRLWRAVDAAGDLYRKTYTGLYCVGCEAFYAPDDLVDGVCPEHRVPPEEVAEENWFFRLSRYAEADHRRDRVGELLVQPPARRNEVLSFLRGGLADLSVSRPASRADGWGIPVPGDPDQVIYVWFDALAYYLTGAGELVAAGGAPRARDRQGHPALPRGLLAGDPALGGPAAAAARCACTTTSPSTAPRSPSPARPRPIRSNSSRATAATRCAGG